MAVITLSSASGSPGVTTTAVAMALNWPRPVVLIEADPTGGSGVLAGFLRGTTEYDVGLIELALSPLDTADALREVVRPLAPDVGFIAGVRAHGQVGALREVWQRLAVALADLDATGQDAIVDAGRLGLVGSPEPLLANADLALLLTRGNLPAIAAARSWSDAVKGPATSWQRAAALMVGDRQPYRAAEIARVLDLAVLAALPDEPEAAAVYHRGCAPPRRFETSTYARALTAAISSIRAQVARNRVALVAKESR